MNFSQNTYRPRVPQCMSLLFGIGNPHPFSRKRMCPPPWTKGGEHTRLRVRGWGSPNAGGCRKSLALCQLYWISYLSLFIISGAHFGYIKKIEDLTGWSCVLTSGKSSRQRGRTKTICSLSVALLDQFNAAKKVRPPHPPQVFFNAEINIISWKSFCLHVNGECYASIMFFGSVPG